jgi:hypothetical protein
MQVLRDSLDAFARSPDAYSSSIPIVTARLIQDLLSFNFVGQSADDLKGGLHPFIIADGNSERPQNNLEVARLYGLLTAGDAACTLADLETLNSKEVESIPVTYSELESTLGMFGNLIGVILGLRHPIVRAFQDMWILMQSQLKSDLHTALEYRSYVKPTHLLQSVQLICFMWFTHKHVRLTQPTPDFATILHQIIMQNYVLPNLPSQLYQLVYPKRSYTLPEPIPGSVATSSSGSSSTTGGSGLSIASGVSALTTLSGSGTAPGTVGRGARIANLQPLPNITALVLNATKLKDFMGTLPPPKYNNGSEMCLSFLLKGGCWSNCKQAHSHVAALSNNEQQ